MTTTEFSSQEMPDHARGIPSKNKADSSRFYRPELDVLRFFAFLMVFFSHAWPNSGSSALAEDGIPFSLASGFFGSGAVGVFVFFMLSSYLITELLLRERTNTGTIHIKAYYVRRALRIWPLYFFFIAFCFLIRPLTPDYPFPGRQLVSMLLLSGNWYFSHRGWWGQSFTSHLWSISVEEQFYLVWPLVLKYGGRARLWLACAGLMFVSYLSLSYLGKQGESANPTIFVNSFVLCIFFALGGLAALWTHGRASTLKLPFRAVLLTLGICLIAVSTMVFRIHEQNVVPLNDLLAGYTLTGVGCLAIFFSFLGVSLPRWSGFLIYLGKISYGLYVYHLICIALAWWIKEHVLHRAHWRWSFPFTLLLTCVCASLSYRFIESPFLRFKEKFVFVQSRRV